MGMLVFDDLICGFQVIAFDTPEVVGEPGSLNAIPLRITRSKIRIQASLKSGKVCAFSDWLEPIKVKDDDKRKNAIKQDIIKWFMNNAPLVFGAYKRNIDKPCDGSCDSEVCLQKRPPGGN